MPNTVYRVLKLIKRNAFLYSLYITFFWLRIFDMLLGDNIANILVWTVLWLTPVVYIEPAIRSTFITDYWIKQRYMLFVELFTISFVSLYMCFIKFVIYGTLISVEEVVLMICVSALYHMIDTIRKMNVWDFFISVNAISFFFAVVMKFIIGMII